MLITNNPDIVFYQKNSILAKHLRSVFYPAAMDSGEKNFMNSESFLDKLSSDKLYSRSNLQDLFEKNGHKISDHTLNWLIYNLLKEEKYFEFSEMLILPVSRIKREYTSHSIPMKSWRSLPFLTAGIKRLKEILINKG